MSATPETTEIETQYHTVADQLRHTPHQHSHLTSSHVLLMDKTQSHFSKEWESQKKKTHNLIDSISVTFCIIQIIKSSYLVISANLSGGRAALWQILTLVRCWKWEIVSMMQTSALSGSTLLLYQRWQCWDKPGTLRMYTWFESAGFNLTPVS